MEIGDQIGQYTIVEHIGRGGMADVWSALDERLQRTVAVKTIAANLTDERARDNFRQEARTIAALEHSNILPIYDFGDFGRQLYIVMRYVDGGSLLDNLIEGPLSEEEAIRVGSSLAAALERAHADKVVHRDLKPANVLLDKFRTPYLADFGLAIVIGSGGDENVSSGTLLYMPPEQMMGMGVDHRADIYAFTIMLFQMVTGEFPFEAQAALCLRQIQNGDDLPDPRKYRPDLPERLTTVLRIGTAMDIDARYDSVKLLMSEVTAALRGQGSFSVPSTDAAELIAPRQEAVPYRAETENAMGAVEDMMVTMPGTESDELMVTVDVDSRQVFQQLMTESEVGEDDIEVLMQTAQFDTEEIADNVRDQLLRTAQVDSKQRFEDLQEQLQTMDVDSKSVFEKLIAQSGLGQQAAPPPEPPALREISDMFHRMTRAWSHGQRFLTGATHFAELHTYYSDPEAHGLHMTDAGRTAMLRGAIEHNYELDFWWAQVPDNEARRQVCVYALRSDLVAARTLAVRLLMTLPDTEPPSVAITVGRLLHSETNPDVRLAVVELLANHQPRAHAWRDYAYAVDTDLLLAEQALRDDAPQVAELAARAVGRLGSLKAVELIASRAAESPDLVRRALAFVRDEADSLPASVVPLRQRAGAFETLTWRYLRSNLSRLGLRFFMALLGSGIGLGMLVHFTVRTANLTILRLQHLYRVIGNGQTFGLVAGLGLMLAVALPLRLAGSAGKREDGAVLWNRWGRLLAGFLAGGLVATIAYLNYQIVSLQIPDPELPILLLAGGGMALGAAIAATFRMPLWLRVTLSAITILFPIVFAWQLYNEAQINTPVFYYASDPVLGTEQLWTTSIALALLSALGAFGPEIIDQIGAMTHWPLSRKRWFAYTAAALGVVSLLLGLLHPLLGIITAFVGLFFAGLSRIHGLEQPSQEVVPPYRRWVYIGTALAMAGFWLAIFGALNGFG